MIAVLSTSTVSTTPLAHNVAHSHSHTNTIVAAGLESSTFMTTELKQLDGNVKEKEAQGEGKGKGGRTED